MLARRSAYRHNPSSSLARTTAVGAKAITIHALTITGVLLTTVCLKLAAKRVRVYSRSQPIRARWRRLAAVLGRLGGHNAVLVRCAYSPMSLYWTTP
jgi:hypothetical protein